MSKMISSRSEKLVQLALQSVSLAAPNNIRENDDQTFTSDAQNNTKSRDIINEKILTDIGNTQLEQDVEEYHDNHDCSDFSSDDSIRDPNYAAASSEGEMSENLSPALEVPGDTSQDKKHKKKRARTHVQQKSVYKKNHQIRGPCNCKSRCILQIDENMRSNIWHEYHEMDYNTKRSWIHSRVISKDKRRKITKSVTSRRTRTLFYTLPDMQGHLQEVCKSFFLRTLGYNEKNDKVITTMLKNTPQGAITPKTDRRGQSVPPNKCDRAFIGQHIKSYNPCISHYRREHAPHRLYLPSDITVKSMYEDYMTKYPDKKVSYVTYRKVITEMNISFTKLGNEECDTCVVHFQHIKSHEVEDQNNVPSENLHETGDSENAQNQNDSSRDIMHILKSVSDKHQELCDSCKKWLTHAEKSKLARIEYRNDAGKSNELCVMRSVDLQKVIMLPRIPGSKKACFTKRIIAFHLTFASMQSKEERHQMKQSNIAILWNESLAGRKAEEIASAYYVALSEERDALHVTYWADNCSAQNKNWCFFTMLVSLVNTNKIAAEDITIKYFEAGHTFMSADSVHHGVELSMKHFQGGKIFDFNDFVESVARSNGKNMKVICLQNDNILAWKAEDTKSKKTCQNRPLLANVSVVQFRKGSKNIFYKHSFQDEDYQECAFLKARFNLGIPGTLRDGPRGITSEKKRVIMSELCPILPANRRDFWENIVESDVADLINNDD